uniref:protein acetyllysine N-acetyltransferase n=1 Tax=Latimeria chalumnae TaxID=7897 RepID=H3AHF8_LATCH
MADGEQFLPHSVGLYAVVGEGDEPVAKKSRLDVGDALRQCPAAEEENVEAWEEDKAAPGQGRGPEGVGQAAAPAGGSGGDNGAGLQGLAQQEEGDFIQDAVGQDNPILLNDDILQNGFHSYEEEEEEEEDDDDDDDEVSQASSSDWTPRPRIGPYTFVQQHLMNGTDPRTILKDLLPGTIPELDLDDMTLWQIVIKILSEPPKRKKHKDINTLEDVVRLLQECKKIVILTGAGVSVSCGIPDFRSRDGIYARLAVDFPDFPDPQAMFDIDYFRRDPRPFFKFAKEIYPGQFQPSPCHKFIAMLDKEGKLLRNYSQNIDTLEKVAGIQKIIECHGSFATASCLICKYMVDCEVIRKDIFNQVRYRKSLFPLQDLLFFPRTWALFFGNDLKNIVCEVLDLELSYLKESQNVFVCIGYKSLQIHPSLLLQSSSIPHEVPQILINREPLPHFNFDVELLGDCDVIINELCHRLGGEYKQLCYNPTMFLEITEKPPRLQKGPEMQSVDLPPTPSDISGDSSSQDEIIPTFLQTTERLESTGGIKSENAKSALESKENFAEGNSSGAKIDNTVASPENNNRLQECEQAKKNTLGNEGNAEKKSDVEIRCHVSRFAKEQISRRLNDSQYLFLTPNRYIFHGAEVYSDSEEDEGSSSSSCGSNSDNESHCSPSVGEVGEDESDTDEFYNGVEFIAEGPDGDDGVTLGVNSEEKMNMVTLTVCPRRMKTGFQLPSHQH